MARRGAIKQRHLDCFLAIIRAGSINGAAEQLNLSQPALSRTLSDLEEKLGARVMDRSRTGVALTEAGEIFLRYASASVSALEQGLVQISLAQRGDRQAVTVGALPNVSARVLPKAVAAFRQANPQVMVRILDGTNRQLMQLLRLGEADFVVGRLAAPEDMLGLAFEPLYSEELTAVVRPGHPATLASTPEELAAILSEVPQILPIRGTIIREDAEQMILATGARPSESVIETVSVAFGRSFVQITDAVWLTALGVVEPDIESGFLVPLPLVTGATRAWVGITTRRGYPLSRQAERLQVVLRASA